MRSLKIIRVDGPQRRELDDLITEEISLRLLAGHRRIAELLCSPQDLEDLVLGFFYTNGFIRRPEQILQVVVNRASWSAFIELAPEIDPDGLRLSGVVGSACGATLPPEPGREEEQAPAGREAEEWQVAAEQGRAGREAGAPGAAPRVAPAGQPGETGLSEGQPPFTVSARRVSDLMEELRRRSEVHRRTGGVHAAALADPAADGPAELLVFREDIGRHNAVDKAVGALLAQGRPIRDTLLLSSGRLSSEILHKAARCRIPLVVSRSAPTDRAVALARERRITLIGFARGRRMNLYSEPGRVAK